PLSCDLAPGTIVPAPSKRKYRRCRFKVLISQGSNQAPSTKESPRPLTTYSKHRATEFRPELADQHHSSIEAALMSHRCPVSVQCCPKERGTKRKTLGMDKRSARFLCAVSIFCIGIPLSASRFK